MNFGLLFKNNKYHGFVFLVVFLNVWTNKYLEIHRKMQIIYTAQNGVQEVDLKYYAIVWRFSKKRKYGEIYNPESSKLPQFSCNFCLLVHYGYF